MAPRTNLKRLLSIRDIFAVRQVKRGWLVSPSVVPSTQGGCKILLIVTRTTVVEKTSLLLDFSTYVSRSGCCSIWGRVKCNCVCVISENRTNFPRICYQTLHLHLMEVKAGDSDAVVIVKQRLLEGPSDAVVAVNVDTTVDSDSVHQQRRGYLKMES